MTTFTSSRKRYARHIEAWQSCRSGQWVTSSPFV